MYSKTAVLVFVLAALLFGGTIVGQDFDNPDCSIETFSMSPNSSSFSQGTHVQLYGRGSCSGGVRAVRFEVFGTPKAEIGSSQQSETFKTEEFSPGRGLVCFAVAGGGNSSWLAAERRCVSVTIESRSGNTSSSEANSGPGSSSGNNSTGSGSNGSSSSNSSSSTFGGDMNVWGWCQSMGHAGSDYSGDAYSWFCFNADGSYARGIDVDAVCRFSSNGSHPYAGLRNASDAYSWFCATSPQGRPQSSNGNTQQSSGNSSNSNSGSSSGNSNSGSGSSGSNGSSGNSGNSSSNSSCYMPVSVGDGARVTPGEPNNRRAGPGTSYRQTGSLPGGTAFTVTDTACGNGYGWVQVDNNGWTATGTTSDPWVERWSRDLNPPVPQISPIVIPYEFNNAEIELAAAWLQSFRNSIGKKTTWDEAIRRVTTVVEPLADCGETAHGILQAISTLNSIGIRPNLTRDYVVAVIAQSLSELGTDGLVALIECTELSYNLTGLAIENAGQKIADYLVNRLYD